MKIRGVAFAVVAIALAAAAQAGAGGPSTISATYTVDGRAVPGVDTGLVLQRGQTVTVTAGGGVCPFGDSYCPGPNGSTAIDTTTVFLGGFPLPGAPAWGLVGRVGSGPWVQVGPGPKTLSGTGALVFAVNDDLAMLWDNRGSFTVTVSYSCWPGWGYGDKNHRHCGPPGLVSKDVPPTETGGEACKPGWGNGDENHLHCGPPGLVGKDQTSGSDSADGNGNGNAKADADPQADDHGNGNGNAKNEKGKG